MRAWAPIGGIRRFRHYTILIIVAAAGGLFTVFPPSIFECDAVINSSCAIHAETSFVGGSHHTGYSFIAYLASLLARRFSPPLNPIHLLRYISIACGIAGAYIFYQTLLQLNIAPPRAACASGALLFSYAYWHYTLQADSHIAAALLVTIFFWRFLRLLRAPTVRGGIMSGLFLGTATLMHISNVLLLPAVIVSSALVWNKQRTMQRAIASLSVAFISTITVPMVMVARRVAEVDSIGELWTWVNGCRTWGTWGTWSWRTPIATAIGVARSFIGSHYLLKFEHIQSLALRLFPVTSFEDELAISEMTPQRFLYPLIVIHGIVLTLALAITIKGFMRIPRLLRINRPLAVFLLLWIAVYGLFFAWWAPERAEFWIAWFIPVFALAALRLPLHDSKGKSLGVPAAIILLGGLLFVNFFGSVYPQSGPLSEIDTDIALAIGPATNLGDIIIADHSFAGRASRYFRSFAKVNLLECCLDDSGTAGAGTLYRRDRHPQRCLEDPTYESDLLRIDPLVMTRLKDRAVSMVDSIITEAELRHRAVYLIAEPLSTDPGRASVYTSLIEVIAERYDISCSVPLRYDIDLRTVTKRW